MTGAALIGADFEYQMTDKFSLAAGLNYSLQGVGAKDQTMRYSSGNVEAKNIRLELGYVKIPVMANYYFAKGWAVKAGVQFGFLTNANIKFRAESGKTTIDYTQDVKDDSFETFDFSIPFGISYQFNKPWVIDARYQLGLTKVNKEGNNDYKNSVFMITVGYKFAL